MPELSARAQQEEYAGLLQEKADRLRFNALSHYKPYPKQAEFHAQGKVKSERMLGAGNQLGKTYPGAMELAYHATGLYPDDWDGAVFKYPITGWFCGVSGKEVRDNPQGHLIGSFEDETIGCGSIPKDCLIACPLGIGVKNLVDHIKVKHISGGYSLLYPKSYDQGRIRFQGKKLDVVWADEEAPDDIYQEAKTRTNNGQLGVFIYTTFTPLLGMTPLVKSFYEEIEDWQGLTIMTIFDVPHYTDAERAQILNGYKDWERDARAMGQPKMGEGVIFQFRESQITCEPFDVPKHWPVICGLDFGWNHPQAAIKIRVDPETDTLYVTGEYREKEQTPAQAGDTLRSWGKIPFAWPHDGNQHDKGSGKTLASMYRDAGLELLPKHATHPEGGYSLEDSVMEIMDRFETGRLKIFTTCTKWLGEFRLYHRSKGKIVKLDDDLISATRYAIMMLRYAGESSEVEKAKSYFFRNWC